MIKKVQPDQIKVGSVGREVSQIKMRRLLIYHQRKGEEEGWSLLQLEEGGVESLLAEYISGICNLPIPV